MKSFPMKLHDTQWHHQILRLHVWGDGYLLLVPSCPVSSPTAEKGNSMVFVFCKQTAVILVTRCASCYVQRADIPAKQSLRLVRGSTSLIEDALH